MTNEVPFQFGIRRLMFVTSLVALVMAIAIRIGIVAQTFFGCILFFLGVWAFFRGRRFVVGLRKLHHQRKEVMRRRAKLEEELRLALRNRNSVEDMTESTESRRHDGF